MGQCMSTWVTRLDGDLLEACVRDVQQCLHDTLVLLCDTQHLPRCPQLRHEVLEALSPEDGWTEHDYLYSPDRITSSGAWAELANGHAAEITGFLKQGTLVGYSVERSLDNAYVHVRMRTKPL